MPTTKQAAATSAPVQRFDRNRLSGLAPSAGSSVMTCQPRCAAAGISARSIGTAWRAKGCCARRASERAREERITKPESQNTGTETTALTLAWALYETSRRPEIAERIRREGDEVYGNAGREPTSADYSALAYTRAVIQETMRIYPPIWGLIRVAAEEDEIGGKKVLPGDRIVMFAYGAHHDARFWDDPEEFRPERWMGDAAKKRQKYTYLPFGGGRRSCIGGAMSQVENTLALSILLRRFEPVYTGEGKPGINATVTLTPKGGLMFKVKERS